MVIKPRIAFCFSGQARTLDQTYLFFQKNLFDAANEQGFDYDVFCAVEDDEDVEKVDLLNPTKVVKIKSCEVEKIIEDRFGNFIRNDFPKKYCFVNYSPNTLKNLLQQYYKIQKCFVLAKNSGNNYDISLRIRFDTIFLNKLNFEEIKKHVKDNVVICNSWPIKRFISLFQLIPIRDFYFIGNINLVNILSLCFDNFKSGFNGHEISSKSKIIYKLFSIINKINVNSGYRINKITHAFAILNSLFFKSYTSEATFHDYLVSCKFMILKTKISLILIRKDIKKSFVFLDEKTNFEL